MDFKEFYKGILPSITFSFTLGTIALVLYTHSFGIDTVSIREVIAVLVISILISLTGIVLCSDKGIRRKGLFIRHIIRALLIVGIFLSVATFEGWFLWREPRTVLPLLGIVITIYSIAIMIEFYESKKRIDEMNKKLKLRNKK